jgi:hypothetical protein
MTDARAVAFGPLNLTPAEFGILIPGEFLELCEGYNERERLAGAKLSLLINAHLFSKPIKAEDLMPPEKTARKTKPEKTATEKKKELADLKRKFKQ